MPPKIYECSESESESEEEKEEPVEYYTNKKGKLVKRRKRKVQPKKEKPKPKPSIIFEDDEKEINEWGLDIPLYKHQENSVLKMENLEDNPTQISTYHDRYSGNRKIYFSSRVGILSDKVGSGKTLTTVSFLSRKKKKYSEMFGTEEDINKIYKKGELEFINIELPCLSGESYYFSYKKTYKTTFIYFPLNIIVIGASVYTQWINELKHSNLTFKVIYKNVDFEDVDKWISSVDIVLITYNRYNDLCKTLQSYIDKKVSQNGINLFNYQGYCFRRIVFDEVQVYGRLEELYALNYWIISATVQCSNDIPYRNKNNRSVNMMMRILSNVPTNFVNIRNSEEDLARSYQQAEVINKYYQCYIRDLNNLMNHLTPEIQRMLAADNISGAIAALGGHKENKSISDIIIEKEEKAITEIKASIVYYQTINNEDKVKEITEKLEKAEKSLQNLKNKLEESEKEECPICCDEFEGKDKVLTDCCKYIICSECITNLYKTSKKCPFCRNLIDLSKMIVSSSTHVDEDEKEEKTQKEEIEKPKPKPETVIDIIKANPNGKFLLFSEYSSTFDNITGILNQNHISWSEVKGTTDTKQKHIRDYKNGLTKVLFLNARSDGTGINLPETTDIILYHQLSSSAIETQILGRALRLGRTSQLRVHRLLSNTERRIQSDANHNQHLHNQQLPQLPDPRSGLPQENNIEIDLSSDSELSNSELDDSELEDERNEQEQSDYELAIRLQRELNM